MPRVRSRLGGRCGELNVFALAGKHRPDTESKLELGELNGVFVAWSMEFNKVLAPCSVPGTAHPDRYGCSDFFRFYGDHIRVIGQNVQPDTTGEDDIKFDKVPNPQTPEYACSPVTS